MIENSFSFCVLNWVCLRFGKMLIGYLCVHWWLGNRQATVMGMTNCGNHKSIRSHWWIVLQVMEVKSKSSGQRQRFSPARSSKLKLNSHSVKLKALNIDCHSKRITKTMPIVGLCNDIGFMCYATTNRGFSSLLVEQSAKRKQNKNTTKKKNEEINQRTEKNNSTRTQRAMGTYVP